MLQQAHLAKMKPQVWTVLVHARSATLQPKYTTHLCCILPHSRGGTQLQALDKLQVPQGFSIAGNDIISAHRLQDIGGCRAKLHVSSADAPAHGESHWCTFESAVWGC